MEVHYSFLSASVREALWKSIANKRHDFNEQACSNILLGLANLQFSSDVLNPATLNAMKETIANINASEFKIQVRKELSL
jgi:hypothetical protein